MRNSAFHHKTFVFPQETLCSFAHFALPRKTCMCSQNFCIVLRTSVFPHKFCNPQINSFYSQNVHVSLTTLLYPPENLCTLSQLFASPEKLFTRKKFGFPKKLCDFVYSHNCYISTQEISVHFCKCSIASFAWPQETLHLFAKLSHFSQETLCSRTKLLRSLKKLAHKSFDTEAANTNIFSFTMCP